MALPLTSWSDLGRSKILAVLATAGLVFLLLAGARQAGLLRQAELTAYDLLHLPALLGPDAPAAEVPGITLVWISDEDERRFGGTLPDIHLARALERLIGAGAAVIGIDLYRDQPVLDKEGVGGAEDLSRLLRDQANLVAVFLFGGVGPPPALEGSDRIGFSDFVYDEGGAVRRGLLFLDDGERFAMSFPLVLALRYLEAAGIGLSGDPDEPGHMRIGPTTVPPLGPDFGGYKGADTRGYQYLLDFRRSGRAFQELELGQVIDGDFAPEEVRGRIVILGNRTATSKDWFFTPYSRWLPGDQRVFGAQAQAIAAAQLIDMAHGKGEPIRDLAERWEYLWILAWTLAGGMVGLLARSYLTQVPALALGLAALGSTAVWAFAAGWWLPLFPSALGFAAAAAFATLILATRERRERREIMQLFARRVSPKVAGYYWDQRERLLADGRLPPRQLTATVLFTDLKNFTSVAEHTDAPTLMEWLNSYMEVMVEAVFAHQGHLDKMIGDAVMAVFGVPFPSATREAIAADAANAVECALDMARRLATFNARWAERGFPPIGMRIGIHTGALVAGTLGSAQRQEYTVIGDTVNTASRLESFDKDLDRDAPCRILLGEATVDYLAGRYPTEPVGDVALKGKAQRVRVHRLVI